MTEPYGYDEDPQDVDNDEGEDGEKYVRLTRAQIRSMEKDAKAARKDREEAQNLRRELALTRAGVGDLTERQHRALLATIEGDITPESVRAAAEDLGFVQPPAEAPAAEEQRSMERMSQASAAATGEVGSDKIAGLEKAAAMGYDALLAQIQADGHRVVTAS